MIPAARRRLPARLYAPQHRRDRRRVRVAARRRLVRRRHRRRSTASRGRWPTRPGAGVSERRVPAGARAPLAGRGRRRRRRRRLGASAPARAARHRPARVVRRRRQRGRPPRDGRRAPCARRPALRALLLVYPALEPRWTSESYTRVRRRRRCSRAPTWRAAGAPTSTAPRRGEPDASPLLAERPATACRRRWIAVAGQDLLRDDGLRYAEALRAAGVEVELERYEDMTHGFLRWGGVVDRARELVAALGEHARAALAAPAASA